MTKFTLSSYSALPYNVYISNYTMCNMNYSESYCVHKSNELKEFQ